MGLAAWAVLGGVVGYLLCVAMGGQRGYISFVLTFAAAGVVIGLAFRLLHMLWALVIIVALIAVLGGIISALRG